LSFPQILRIHASPADFFQGPFVVLACSLAPFLRRTHRNPPSHRNSISIAPSAFQHLGRSLLIAEHRAFLLPPEIDFFHSALLLPSSIVICNDYIVRDAFRSPRVTQFLCTHLGSPRESYSLQTFRQIFSAACFQRLAYAHNASCFYTT